MRKTNIAAQPLYGLQVARKDKTAGATRQHYLSHLVYIREGEGTCGSWCSAYSRQRRDKQKEEKTGQVEQWRGGV